jgi:hypothetical protein
MSGWAGTFWLYLALPFFAGWSRAEPAPFLVNSITLILREFDVSVLHSIHPLH